MASEKGWDQQIFNEEALFPAHGGSTTGLVSIRILDFMRFVNSKTFFKAERRRFIPGDQAALSTLPVMVVGLDIYTTFHHVIIARQTRFTFCIGSQYGPCKAI